MPKVSAEHLALRRGQILEGARRCFAEYGYEGATVRRLEKVIGLSRGAIFHHFRDKDTLFLALASQDAARMADIAAAGGIVQVMRTFLADPAQYDWLATRLEISRRVRTDPEFRARWQQRSAEVTNATRARLQERRAAGMLRDDVPTDVLLTYLDVVLDGLITHLVSGQADPTQLAAALDLVEASVRGQPR